MKGVIFNLLEEVVVQEHGLAMWDDLLSTVGSDGAYTSLGSYPDAQLQAIVLAASDKLKVSPSAVLSWFGVSAMPLLSERYPKFFAPYTSTKSFILSVNSIIHPEVRKVYPGAIVPTFSFEEEPDGALVMQYNSPRRLCALAQGFAEGAASHFGESVAFTHLKCMHSADSYCLCRMVFASKE